MTASEAVCLTRTHIEAKFPKTCTSCGKRYGSLHEYLVETRHVGLPVSYDEEIDDISPTEPFGTISFANCTCGIHSVHRFARHATADHGAIDDVGASRIGAASHHDAPTAGVGEGTD